ncbi:plasmolipin-like [Limulus polyphemus]|uniref:Plasmolipin-like n=1 Tax=Limulus polyphemus TaxID=6850 RepID=A0ABM1BLC5_LIMPO|nr:plasmolipin-like [Limulus polyphemus]
MAGEVNALPQVQQKETQSTTHSAAVTATVKTESTGVGEGLKLNPWYFKTVPGILKLVQVVIAIICFGCGSPAVTDFSRFFLFVVSICFIVTILLIFVYLFGLKALLPNLPWLFSEMVYTAIAVVLYIIGAIVELAMTGDSKYTFALKIHRFYNPYMAAGVFGLFNIVAYGAGLAFIFKEWRESRQVS